MTREVQFADVQDPPAIRMHDFPIVARIEEQVGNSFQKAWQRFDISATEVAKSQGSHAARVGEMVADLTKVLVNSAKASPPAKPSSEEIAIRLLRAGVIRTRGAGEEPVAYKQQATPYIWLARHCDESLMSEADREILRVKGGVRAHDRTMGRIVEYRDPCAMMLRSGYSWTRVYAMFKVHYRPMPESKTPSRDTGAAAVETISSLLDRWNGRLPRAALDRLSAKLAAMKSTEDLGRRLSAPAPPACWPGVSEMSRKRANGLLADRETRRAA